MCITIPDEDHLLQDISSLRELRFAAEDMQVDHDHHAQPEETKLIEEYISEREMKLEHEVSGDVWTLYVREGEEGIRRRQEERELEAERRFVEAELPEWKRRGAVEVEQEREYLVNALEADMPYPVELSIQQCERLIHLYPHNETERFWSQEYGRVNRERYWQVLEMLRNFLPAFQAAKRRRDECRSAAAQQQNEIKAITTPSDPQETGLVRIVRHQPHHFP